MTDSLIRLHYLSFVITEPCPAFQYIGFNQTCFPCHSECQESCHGPTSYDCEKCRNFKVDVKKGNSIYFNCTDRCPKEYQSGLGKNICLPCLHVNVNNDCIGKSNF